MLNQKIKSFTLNVSIRICQTINLKIVATQVISYQVRTSSILLHLMLIIYGKLLDEKSYYMSGNHFLSPLRFLLLDKLG